MLTRRIFLRGSAMAMAGAGSVPFWLGRAAAKARWDAKSPEEKAQARQQMQARWAKMTPDEKKQFAEQHPRAAAALEHGAAK